MQDLFWKSPITALQHAELTLNVWTQKTLQPAEPLWNIFNEQFSAAQIMDFFVPLVGVFHHPLLVRLVCSLSVLNTLCSLIKWCSPAYRPYWWIREYESEYNVSSAIQQHRLTCETTAGFPSSHVMSFTTFSYLVVAFSFTSCCRKFKFGTKYLSLMCHFVVGLASVGMWLSRLYLASQFLHQCVLTSFAAIGLLFFFDRHSTFLYTLSRRTSIVAVLCFGIVPVVIYFAMLHMENVDPHWSVRMAFKWCSDPSYLRHEASPIFVLGRDFGYLMGVALSAPMYKRYENKRPLFKRLPFLFVLEVLNYFARQETPKQRGRFIFVAYEFTRNLIHSYTLLSILPKIL